MHTDGRVWEALGIGGGRGIPTTRRAEWVHSQVLGSATRHVPRRGAEGEGNGDTARAEWPDKRLLIYQPLEARAEGRCATKAEDRAEGRRGLAARRGGLRGRGGGPRRLGRGSGEARTRGFASLAQPLTFATTHRAGAEAWTRSLRHGPGH